jgi:peptidoglycan/LPS O-acetylase OafA/YrhL
MPALDRMRGIAVLAVLAHNFDVVDHIGVVSRSIDAAMNLGWIGVQLFFVLSGFLITGILLDTARSSSYYKTFFARRTLRIFPLYYAVLAFGFFVLPHLTAVPPGHGSYQSWLWSYLSNWAEPYGRTEPAFPHFWSLAVEEQFYLLWPFVIRRMSARRVVQFTCVLLLIVPVVRYGCRIYINADAAYTFTICRLDALAVGAMLAAALRDDKLRVSIEEILNKYVAWIRFPRLPLVAALAALVAISHGLSRTGAVAQTAGYSVIALLAAAWILVEVHAEDTGNVSRDWLGLGVVGKYSYAMYVFHAPLHLLLGVPLLARVCNDQSPSLAIALLYVMAATAATFVLAVASYYVLERPFLRMKNRFAVQNDVV